MTYKKGRSIVYLVIAIVVLVVGVCLLLRNQRKTIEIRENKIKVEVVTNSMDQYRGLSGRKKLCWDCGMLFSFKEKEIKEFVMRDMNFPLDIIFIADNRIIKIDEKLPWDNIEALAVYNSEEPVDNVLEVNGGYVSDKGIEVGDFVSLKK